MKNIFIIILFVFCLDNFCQVPFFVMKQNKVDTVTSYVTVGPQTWLNYNITIDDGEGGIYFPNGDVDSVAKYGYLYNWEAAKRIVNTYYYGWHIPTYAEINTTLWGTTGNDFGKIKEIGFVYWNSPNTGATNETGFNLKAAGRREGVSVYSEFRTGCYMWTVTTASGSEKYCCGAGYNTISRYGVQSDTANVYHAVSLRLIKD